MIVTLIDVGQPQSVKTQRGSYQVLEVSYRNDQGQIQGKKIVSFSNPQVFKDIQTFQKDDRLDITATKDDSGYWQWQSIRKEGEAGSSTAPVASNSSAKTRVTGSNYETSEERAKRQVYIVRQSSISSAVQLLTSSKKDASVDDVLAMAKTFEAYVFDTGSQDEVE